MRRSGYEEPSLHDLEERADEAIYIIVRDAPAHWQMWHRDGPVYSTQFDRLRKSDRHGYMAWLWEFPFWDLCRCIGYLWPDGRITAEGMPPTLYDPKAIGNTPNAPFPTLEALHEAGKLSAEEFTALIHAGARYLA